MSGKSVNEMSAGNKVPKSHLLVVLICYQTLPNANLEFSLLLNWSSILKQAGDYKRTPYLHLEFWIQFVSWHSPQKKKKKQDFLHIHYTIWLHVFLQIWWKWTRDEAELQLSVSLMYTSLRSYITNYKLSSVYFQD